LPTSLTYILLSTRGCSPRRPDAVISTTRGANTRGFWCEKWGLVVSQLLTANPKPTQSTNPQTSSTGSDFHGPSKRHRTPLYSSALPATSTLSPDDLIPGYSSVSVPEDGSSQPLAKEASHTHQVRLLTRTDNSCRALRRRLRALCSLCCHSFKKKIIHVLVQEC